MANLVRWLEEALEAGETIQSTVIGDMGWPGFGDEPGYGSEGVPLYNEQLRGKVLSWNDARRFLDYDFDDGFGAPGCNAVYAWTAKRVFFINQYDGRTKLSWVPRDPCECEPTMPGG